MADGMDQPIKRSRISGRAIGYLLVAVVATGAVWWFIQNGPTGRSLNVAAERLTVSEVVTGTFDDTIPLRGQVFPQTTVYLDAVEGGRVEEVFVLDGADVVEGDPIVRLSNTQLQLDVISREAQVAEQINNLRNTQLAIEQNQLQYRRDLVDIEYQILRLGRLVERRRQLRQNDNVSQAALEEVEDEYNYYRQLRDVTVAARDTDARVRQAQLEQLEESNDRLNANLEIARENLENLTVRAPREGQLTGLNAEIGQSINRGDRLGQIDDTGGYKVTAFVDEFYLPRLDNGQVATFSHRGRDYELQVQRIYPQVRNGQFEVDFTFEDDQPADVRRGQALQLRLQLGASETAVLIPNGAFYQDTGGAWVFLVSSSGDYATRRNVRLGRRNSRFIEVLDGLAPGDRVITSSYSNYLEIDRVELTD